MMAFCKEGLSKLKRIDLIIGLNFRRKRTGVQKKVQKSCNFSFSYVVM